jgi:hypothetical protein
MRSLLKQILFASISMITGFYGLMAVMIALLWMAQKWYIKYLTNLTKLAPWQDKSLHSHA